MAGLNDGWELEGEIPGANENGSESYDEAPLDITQETAGILAFENSMSDLNDLAADIEEAEGMSQDFAVAAESICPGILSRTTKHFSPTPTATGLKVAMEELNAGVWALIGATVAAVIAIIIKIYNWFTGGSSTDTNGSGAAVAKAKAAEEAPSNLAVSMRQYNDEMHALIDIVKNGISVKDAALTGNDSNQSVGKYSEFDPMIAKMAMDESQQNRIKNFMDGGDHIFHDILIEGPYTTTMMEAAVSVAGIKSLLTVKADLAKFVVETVGPEKDAMFEKLTAPTLVKFHGKEVPVQDVVRAILESEHAIAGSTHGSIRFADLFNKFNAVISKKKTEKIFKALTDSMEVIAKIQQDLDDFEKLVKKQTVARNNAPTDPINVVYRRVLTKFSRDVSAYAKLIGELQMYCKRTLWTAGEVSRFGVTVVNRVSKAMTLEDGSLADDWKKHSEALRKHQSEISKIYVVTSSKS